MIFSRNAMILLARATPRHSLLLAMVAAALLGLLGAANEAQCARIAWWQHPQREQVEIIFSRDLPVPDVRRIDPLTVRILATREAWGPPQELTLPAFTGASLLQALVPEGDGVLVRLQSKAFGFVTQYDGAARRLTIDFVPDPLGGRWMFDPPASRPLAERPPTPQPEPSAPPTEPPAPGPAQPSERKPVSRESVGVIPDASTPDVPPTADANVVRRPMPASDAPPSPELSVPSPPPPEEKRFRIERTGSDVPQPVETTPQPSTVLAEAPDVAGDSPPALPAEPRTEVRPEALEMPLPQPQTLRREIVRDAPRPAAQPDPPGTVLPMDQPDPIPDPALEPLEMTPEPERGMPPEAEDETLPPAPLSGPEESKDDDTEDVFRKQLSMARVAMMNSEFEQAAFALGVLATMPTLPDTLREDVLYDLADALFSLHMDDLAGHFAKVAGAYEQAMNANPASHRAATALRNLGIVHLRVNNLPEAQAYFNVLRQQHPYDPVTPSADYHLGEFFLERGDYLKAADHFQVVVDKYPEHSIAQQSSIGLARSLYALGFDDKAFQIMDYLERRWPRYYIDDPSLLELAGIIALRSNSLESARQRLLTYYNLVPDSPDVDMLLARLGDIYLLTGKPDAARHVFEKAARMYPDKEGGLIAQMRLVEGGIHDDPSLEDMFINLRAAQVYTHIIENHPQSPLAAVATVKLAIWQVWNKRLEDSLDTVRDFLDNRPHHSLAPKALEVGLEAFSQLVERNLQDARHEEIVEQWNRNSFLHPLESDFSIEDRLGLATAFWKTGDHERALLLARPHLQGLTPQQTQGIALDLVLGIYLEQQQWEQIVSMEPLRKELQLSPHRLRELDYALALALENLGQVDTAHPYWLALASDMNLETARRGYSLYFLARQAMQDEDLEKVYLYAQEALSLLMLESRDSAKIRDCISWLTQVTERTGRLQESLAWALEFDQLIDQDDPHWPMYRYRLAQLYQRAQAYDEWRRILLDLQQKDPRGLYGRLAGSALQGRELEDSLVRFGQQ